MANSISFNLAMQSDYQELFDTCVITKNARDVNKTADRIIANQQRYEDVCSRFDNNIPWYFVGIIHCMEGSLSFDIHLHNGDPLTNRTVHVPTGRPRKGDPPFEWERSAVDALTFEGIGKWTDWSIPGLLYKFEGFNGFGYRRLKNPINSPYLWSFSNHYSSGKFVKDRLFDPSAVSNQIGAAVLMKKIIEKQSISISGVADRINRMKELEPEKFALINELGEEVIFDPSHRVQKAKELQILLNNLTGSHLDTDGKAGRHTSDAFFDITNRFLKGDPKVRQLVS
jgi:lysozyme family protein